MAQSALLFGSTGLIGSHLLSLLLSNDDFTTVNVFVRKSTGIIHPKLHEHFINFDDLSQYKEIIKGDVLFCCLGTTIRKAGSQEAFRKVDFELPVQLAEIAAMNHVEKFVVISSLGADRNSRNFYLRTKGEMEEKIQKNKVKQIAILRPSMLLGKREEFRFGELIGKGVMSVIGPALTGKLKKYRGIHASVVAMAMIKIAKTKQDRIILESDKIQEIGARLN